MDVTNAPPTVADRPRRFGRPWPAPVRYALRGAALLLILCVVVIGAGIAIILTGPTEIGFIRDRVQSTLQKSLGSGYQVTVDKTVIDVDPILGLVLEIEGVNVRDSEHGLVASAPSTRIAIDPLALLRLRVEVSNIELSQPEISLVRAFGGEVYLGNAATAHAAAVRHPISTPAAVAGGTDGGFPDLVAALQILDRGLEPSIDAAIRAGFLHFSVVGGTIDIWDAEQLRQRRFPSTDLTASVEPETGKVTANFASSGYGGRWTATFNREIDKSTGGHVLSGLFSQLTIADLFPALGDDRAGNLSTDIPLYGRGTIRYAANGDVEDASVRLDLGAGTIKFGDYRESLLLDEATVKLRWDIANKVVLIDPSPFSFGRTQGVVTGWIRPEGQPGDRRYSFQIQAPGMILAPSDTNAPALVAERVGVSGSVDLKARLITIANAVIQSGDAAINAAGTIGYADGQGIAALAANASPMQISAFKQMWIPFIAPGARRWVIDHIESGRLAEAKFTAAVPTTMLFSRQPKELSADQLRLDLRLEDVTLTTYGDLPPVHHASGNAVLAGTTFGVDVDEGAEVQVPSGATVEVTAGAFAIGNVFDRPGEGNIAVQLSGDAAAIGEIADAKPFLALTRRDVAPADLSGTADVSVSVNLPLARNISEADVDWKVSINATNLASKSPVEGRTFSEANVGIVVTPDDVSVTGKAKIDGVPADVRFSQPLSKAGAAVGSGARYVRFTLDEAARKRLGFGLDEILGGTVGAILSGVKDGGKGEHYELDLKRARLVMPGLGWSKGVGVPAQLSFDMRPVPGGFAVDNLMMTGSGFGLTGSAKLDSNYGLVSADIDNFALRPGDDAAFTLARTKTGYTIAARGAAFDLRGFFTYVRNGSAAVGTSPDLAIDAHIDKVTGFNQEVITGGKLSLVSINGDVQKVVFSGSLGGSLISVNYRDTDAGASLTATSSDAGSVLRFIDLYPRAEGGTLSISAERQGPSGPLAGTLEVRDFDITNEPALQKLLSTPVAKNVVVKGNAASVHFTRLFANFRQGGQTLTIDDAVLRSNDAGATFNGHFDFGASRMQVNGTYLPAYGFNNAFSRVPLIGLVLSGGMQEGLFGVTFRLDGSIDSPRVYFNPLSAVAPGIFRKIFEFR